MSREGEREIRQTETATETAKTESERARTRVAKINSMCLMCYFFPLLFFVTGSIAGVCLYSRSSAAGLACL